MNKLKLIKDGSPLVQAVVALDGYFSDLERLGNQINALDMRSEFDFEHAQRLINRFTECGQGVSDQVAVLATQLNEARLKAEDIAKGVSIRAELLGARKNDQQDKLEEFRILAEKVRALSAEIGQLKPPADENLSVEERTYLSVRFAAFDQQLVPLIQEAQHLRKEARASKMKVLEQNADALSQTLLAVQDKLSKVSENFSPVHKVNEAESATIDL